MVEIATYTEHVLTECEAKSNFGKCPRCSEAIPHAELDQHIADKTCNRKLPIASIVDYSPLTGFSGSVMSYIIGPVKAWQYRWLNN